MPEPLKIAVLGLSHDHVWWDIAGLQRSADVQIVGAWDPEPALRAEFQAKVPGLPVFDDDHHLLHHTYPDAVLLCSNNAECVELAETAADHNLHIIVEKPMANNLAGAERMLAAAQDAGVKLIINWPIAWEPALWHAGRLALSGEYGPLWQVRYRSAHNGPENVGCSPYFVDWLYDLDRNGPGAFTDYTCYGSAVCRWLQGMPQTVTGLAGKYLKAQDTPADNAVLLLGYPTGLSIVEASWTQISSGPRKGGSFHCAQALLEPLGKTLRISTEANPTGETVDAEPVPAHLESLGHYASAIIRETAEPCGILDPLIARDAQAIMEAGWLASQSGEAQRPI